ncbi:hypothetical protein GCM10027513_16450 [Giesbergeria giesbergeri]
MGHTGKGGGRQGGNDSAAKQHGGGFLKDKKETRHPGAAGSVEKQQRGLVAEMRPHGAHTADVRLKTVAQLHRSHWP